MTPPTTMAEALAQRTGSLLWALDLTLYDAEADVEEVRFLATVDITLRPGDTVAPGRRYDGRLRPPSISWSFAKGATVDGGSSADSAAIVWSDVQGKDADIATRRLSVADRPQILKLGHLEVDSAHWLPFSFSGRKLDPVADGWRLDLRTLDYRLDQLLPRRKLLGLGGCLALDGQHSAAVAASSGLAPAAPLCVGTLAKTSQSASPQTLIAKGPIPTADWALWIQTDGRVRWTLRDDTAQVFQLASPDPVDDGQLRRIGGLWDGTTSHLLVNGVSVASMPFTGPAKSDPALTVHLGDDGTGFRSFVGLLDDALIWIGDVPTFDELARWALRELPEEEHRRPRAYWRMNEAGGDTAYDDSLHEHSALLTGTDVEAMWSSLDEGAPDQRDEVRPIGLGSERRVPGLQVGPRKWQVSDVGCHGIGPVDEGAFYLRPTRRWTSRDVEIVTGTGGLSVELPVDWIRTAGSVDFGGLLRLQHLRVTTPTQTEVVRVMAMSTPGEIAVAGGTLTAEAAGGEVTVETVGYEGAAADITIDSDAKTITSAGGLQFLGQLAGDVFTLTSPGNAGTYTLAEHASTLQLRVVEDLAADEGPGVAMSITFEEPYEYAVDLAAGSIDLKGTPSLPLAVAYRGPLSAGQTRGRLARWLAERGGLASEEIDAASFTDFSASDPGTVGLWMGPRDEPTTRQAIDRLSHGASWGTALSSGLCEIARRSLDGPTVVDLHYPRDFIELSMESTVPPIAGQQIRYAHNSVELTAEQVSSLARVRGLGDPDAVAYARRPYLTVDATVDDVLRRRHSLAKDGEPLPARYQREGDAQAGAQQLYDLDAPGRFVLRAVLPLGPLLLLDWRRDLVRLTSAEHPGLADGRAFLLLSVTVDGEAHTMTMLLWG